ncbi:hypothetical protein [Noviherbaspirillum malthae]|uniref:hypothetical protein n=1 Tax=Noviherbaspirillum malthae TaxID=1260987 RepID=UPI00188DE75B|nr:hypothetical protein [Noviherbaspirillum malthae]
MKTIKPGFRAYAKALGLDVTACKTYDGLYEDERTDDMRVSFDAGFEDGLCIGYAAALDQVLKIMKDMPNATAIEIMAVVEAIDKENPPSDLHELAK